MNCHSRSYHDIFNQLRINPTTTNHSSVSHPYISNRHGTVRRENQQVLVLSKFRHPNLVRIPGVQWLVVWGCFLCPSNVGALKKKTCHIDGGRNYG